MANPWDEFKPVTPAADPWAEFKPLASTGPAVNSEIAGLARAGGTGLQNFGINLAGFPGDVGEAVAANVIDPLAQYAGAPPRATTPPAAGFTFPGSPQVRGAVESVLGPQYKPQTTPEEFAKSFGEHLPNMALGTGGLLRRFVSQVAAPSALGETAAQVAKATDNQELAPYARAAGELVGAAAPGGAARVVTPLRADPVLTEQARILRQEGIPVTAGQAVGSNVLRTAESPFSRGLPQGQVEAFTNAMMRRAGEGAGARATTEGVDNMFRRIGNEFDRLAANNVVQPDRQFLGDITQSVQNYRSLTGPLTQVPAVDNAIATINQHLTTGGGQITGAQYQALRSDLGRLEKAATDPQVSRALGGIREALDGAMERTIARTNPDDLGLYRTAREQYRNALVIERAANAGSSHLGLLDPKAARSATQFVEGRQSYARGRGDFSELVHAANDVMTSPTGFPTRAGVVAAPAAAGGMLGTMLAGPGIGTAAGGVAGPLLTSGAINLPFMQTWLRNQLLANPSSTAPRDLATLGLLRFPALMAPQQ